MTNEELVYLYQNGDKQALESIVEQNRGIVFKMANKYYVDATNSIDKEDIEQEGFMGLMIAAGKYNINNPNKAHFITYAVFWIRAKINRFIYKKNTNNETSLNAPTNKEGDNQLGDYIESVDYSFENVEERIYIKQLHEELEQVMFEHNTLKEREILKMHYGWNGSKSMTFHEIGDIFGVTRSMIQQYERIALGKINRSPWGAIKIKEIYNQKVYRGNCSVLGAIEKIDFASKYLCNGVN